MGEFFSWREKTTNFERIVLQNTKWTLEYERQKKNCGQIFFGGKKQQQILKGLFSETQNGRLNMKGKKKLWAKFFFGGKKQQILRQKK